MKSIDVCMATYNGELYLGRQIYSIINQTELVDRVIISDDASRDSTVAAIERIACSEIEVIANKENLGHVGNFERAISRSSADIVFLSDQDDVWMANKVEVVMRIFEMNPEVVMVHHNLTTMNEGGDLLRESYVPLHPEGVQSSVDFILREFFKPRLFGCAMAFRRNILDVLLPFPSCVYAHDHWISVVSAFMGNIYFLDENLVLYRQHGNNLTPKIRRSLSSIIKSRFIFAQMIVYAFIRSRRLGRLK